jgi:hypothetical protein
VSYLSLAGLPAAITPNVLSNWVGSFGSSGSVLAALSNRNDRFLNGKLQFFNRCDRTVNELSEFDKKLIGVLSVGKPPKEDKKH